MAIPPTQLTLLERLRDRGDDGAWRRFEATYRELVVRFSVRQGLQPADAEDVAQAVFASMASALQNFQHDPQRGRFRDYLLKATRNEIARVFSKRARPGTAVGGLDMNELPARAALAAQGTAPADAEFEQEWIAHHYRLALAEIRSTYSPESVAIFERLVQGDSIETAAAAFATTPAAVHKVKQRVRDRMRELIARQVAEEDG